MDLGGNSTFSLRLLILFSNTWPSFIHPAKPSHCHNCKFVSTSFLQCFNLPLNFFISFNSVDSDLGDQRRLWEKERTRRINKRYNLAYWNFCFLTYIDLDLLTRIRTDEGSPLTHSLIPCDSSLASFQQNLSMYLYVSVPNISFQTLKPHICIMAPLDSELDSWRGHSVRTHLLLIPPDLDIQTWKTILQLMMTDLRFLRFSSLEMKRTHCPKEVWNWICSLPSQRKDKSILNRKSLASWWGEVLRPYDLVSEQDTGRTLEDWGIQLWWRTYWDLQNSKSWLTSGGWENNSLDCHWIFPLSHIPRSEGRLFWESLSMEWPSK